MTDFGLSFLYSVQKDLVLNADFINILYRVVAKIVKMRNRESILIPDLPMAVEGGPEVSEEEKHLAIKRIEDATRANMEIEKFNDEVARL